MLVKSGGEQYLLQQSLSTLQFAKHYFICVKTEKGKNMEYYGFITSNAAILIIGTDKSSVESQLSLNGLKESDIQSKLIARFSCSQDASVIILTGFEPRPEHYAAIRSQILQLSLRSQQAKVYLYPRGIQDLVRPLGRYMAALETELTQEIH